MEPKATLIMMKFLTILIIIYPCSAQSRKLASSPSPTPVSEEPLFIGRNLEKKRRPGSMPASCHGMCKQCIPCLPVEVSVRTMEQLDLYYPQVWKCMCLRNSSSATAFYP